MLFQDLGSRKIIADFTDGELSSDGGLLLPRQKTGGHSRKWRYYLAYCEAAFGTRHITVAQFVLSRPDNLATPSAIYGI